MRIYIFTFLLLGSVIINPAFAQGSEGLEIDLRDIENDGKREEIQRYFGYENLLSRYLTQPYDVSVNTNQKGKYVDIGYPILCLMPLVMLGVAYNKKKLFYILASLFIVYLLSSFSYSFVLSKEFGHVSYGNDVWEAFQNSNNKSVWEAVLGSFYDIGHTLTLPFTSLMEYVSGDSDHITYPILLIGFTMILYLIGSSSLQRSTKVYSIIFTVFGFLWLLLSGGIIWYGFLLFPLSYGLIMYYNSNPKFTYFPSSLFIKSLSLLVAVSFVLSSFVNRISNINVSQLGDIKNLGKTIVETNIYAYSTGLKTTADIRESSYRNIGSVLDEINASDDLIYMIGTSMAFEIRDNTNRIYQDGALIQFYTILEKVRDKEEIIEVLKQSGIKYLIVDLYTHTLDQTPERSLTKKFQLLLNTIYQNPRVRLLTTDRVIREQNANGTVRNVNRVFGKEIIDFGTYAIYEVL